MAFDEDEIYKSIRFNHEDDRVALPKWPKLSCSAANELTLSTPDDPDRNAARLAIAGELKLQAGVAVNELSSDGKLTNNSDLAIPTQRAVKAYVDNQIAVVNQSLSTKAALAGAASQDFQSKNLSVSGNLTANGNVSIGTTSSSYKLAIAAGDINIDDGRALRQAGRWVIGGDSKILSIGSSDKSDGRDISFDPGFAGALTIKKDTGNVGIGTANPETKLEVKGNLTLDRGGSPILFTGTGNSELNRYLELINSPARTSASGLKAGGILVSDSYAYANPSKNDLIVKGNVGIGTTNPTNKLHVVGQGPVTIENAGEADILFKDTSSGQQWQVGTNSTGWYVYNNAYFLVVKKDSGSVGIGTTSPNFGLDVRGNNAWIGSGDSSQSQGGWRLGRWPDYPSNDWVYLIRADSTRYQDLAVGALWAGGALRFGTADDLAEMTPVKAEDNLEPGDVVVIENPPDNRVLLARSNKPYDSKVAGVISDPSTAGLIIGGSHPTDVNRDDIKPLALAGRVLTKVTTENGSINAGDFLTTSSTPGHAMKATDSGHTLGKALQSFNGEHNGETKGKIWVLVNLGMS
jgi:hypothetical protein